MCEMCDHIETRIQRYRGLGHELPDPAAVERINVLVEALKQRQQTMHATEMPMAVYRFYTLDSDGALMGSAMRLKCRDDNAAIKHAETIKGHFVEVWQGQRRIGRFNIKP
jgi:hypothetical protein